VGTATAVHWHGMFQKNSSWADGTSFVSQCPIMSGTAAIDARFATPLNPFTGNFLTYTFSANEQSGTYWHHAQQKAQHCDGLRGPLIIYDS
jgi:iron transport multicopper oxidase